MSPWDLTNDCINTAKKLWLCSECGFPKHDVRRVDAVVTGVPDQSTISFLSGCGVGIAATKFLSELGGANLCSYFHVGEVRDRRGVILKEWATFIGIHKIVVRGTDNATYRKCSLCGNSIYFATGRKYLFPAPNPKVNVFDARWGSLVITESLFRRVNFSHAKNLDLSDLRIANSAIDGIDIPDCK
jgi:hypothetical protein